MATNIFVMKPRSSVVISAIAEDGTIVEMLYKSHSAETALAVARPGAIEVRADWKVGDVSFVPVSPHNNLLKHEALVLPSEAEEYLLESNNSR